MCAGPVFSRVFISQSCSVFPSCDISTVTVLIRGSRELPCCYVAFVVWQFVFAQQKNMYQTISMRCTWLRSGVGRGGASFWFAVFDLCKCRPLVGGSQGGEETAATAAGGDQQQHSMGQLSRLLGRPKCFSGREDERHDWSLKFGAIAATLSDHASVWMSGALQRTTETTLDQPGEASARIFARQM